MINRAERRARAAMSALQAAVRTPMTGVGSRTVTVYSPQATKTTTLAMVLWVLAETRGDQVLGVDANPDKGKLRMRLCPAGQPPPARGLSDLIAQVQRDRQVAEAERLLRHVGQLQPALEATPSRLLRMISDNALPETIAGHTVEQYRAAFDLLRGMFAVIGLDIGRSQTTPATRASVAAADHLLVPWEADGTAMNLVLRALEDLVRFGHGELVATATMTVTAQDPASNPQTAVGHLQRYADQRHRQGLSPLWRTVVTVPYDEAAGAVGALVWARLAPATQLAYTRAAAAVATSFSDPPLSQPIPAADGWFAPTEPPPTPAAANVLRSVQPTATTNAEQRLLDREIG